MYVTQNVTTHVSRKSRQIFTKDRFSPSCSSFVKFVVVSDTAGWIHVRTYYSSHSCDLSNIHYSFRAIGIQQREHTSIGF